MVADGNFNSGRGICFLLCACACLLYSEIHFYSEIHTIILFFTNGFLDYNATCIKCVVVKGKRKA
ncbi:hypothetical protein V1514DRAFT_337553 [Lipomyces japonicus]|uniref:uncharacterized protein n=1 Tax=Lipomyces japonicus TaxID=56871 RepID=UPI0034CEC002